jgi:hypothetical protein
MPLSPHTPPGTHVVVTWQSSNLEDYVYKIVKPKYRNKFFSWFETCYEDNALEIGEKHVLFKIFPVYFTLSGYGCSLVGREGSYALEHFDVASLPKSITDLLVSKPVDEVV